MGTFSGGHMGSRNRLILKRLRLAVLFVLCGLELQACSQNRFGFSQPVQQQSFQMVQGQVSTTQIAPRADILWVVDSSGSMEPFQTKLKNAFQTFSTTYLQQSASFGQWDVR